MNIYEIKKITKRRGDFALIIEDLNLMRGGIYAITGPNGSGKTSFLNLLSFLEAPDDGEIVLKNSIVNFNEQSSLLENRRKISYLQQNPYLFSTNVYENVAYGLKLRKIPGELINERVKKILGKLSLLHLANRDVGALSGGEAQRVALARTLVIESDVLLLDEPTANIDKHNVSSVEELILSMTEKEKTTVIITTHSQKQAYRLSENIITLIDGRINNSPIENIFAGELNEINGKRTISVENMHVTLDSKRTGFAKIVVPPQKVILSREKNESSSCNSFSGTIERVIKSNGYMNVFVNAGIPFCSTMTKSSFDELGLSIGNKVWVSFTTTSVRIIE